MMRAGRNPCAGAMLIVSTSSPLNDTFQTEGGGPCIDVPSVRNHQLVAPSATRSALLAKLPSRDKRVTSAKESEKARRTPPFAIGTTAVKSVATTPDKLFGNQFGSGPSKETAVGLTPPSGKEAAIG